VGMLILAPFCISELTMADSDEDYGPNRKDDNVVNTIEIMHKINKNCSLKDFEKTNSKESKRAFYKTFLISKKVIVVSM
jgi:hypothetical protein